MVIRTGLKLKLTIDLLANYDNVPLRADPPLPQRLSEVSGTDVEWRPAVGHSTTARNSPCLRSIRLAYDANQTQSDKLGQFA